MRARLWLTLLALTTATMANAQTSAPVNARASVDGNGLVTVDWMAPFAADFFDDFENGTADDWTFDSQLDWSVADGRLQSFWHASSPGQYQWTSAYLHTQTYSEGIYEFEVTKSFGSANYAISMILFTGGHFPEGTESGYVFSFAPGTEGYEFSGQYYVSQLIDGTEYRLDGWRYSPAINNGLGTLNTLSVAYEEDSIVFYINGLEVFQTFESGAPSGYLSIAAAESSIGFGDWGRVEWEYIGIDDQSGGQVTVVQEPINPGLPVSVLDNIDMARAPLFDQEQAEQVHSTNHPVLSQGFFDPLTGTRELDEFLNYNVYRDGILVGSPTEDTFSETLAEFGLFEYLVTAEYDEGESSADVADVLYRDPAGIVIDEDFNGGFPDGWTIESTIPQHTWHIDDGSEVALFDTPYMLVNDQASGGADLSERLVTPAIDVNEASLLILEFDHHFFDADAEYGHIQYQLNGGAWHSVHLYHLTMADSAHARWDLSDYISGGTSVKLGFLYDDLFNSDGLYWGIDNVSVYVEGDGVQQDFVFDLTPVQLVIQPEGGTIEYNAELINNTGSTAQNVHYWTYVDAPDGNTYGPLTNLRFDITPFMTYNVMGLTLDVPGNAPGGNYTFRGVVGYQQGPRLSDEFGFLKLGLASTDDFVFDPNEWISAGRFIAEGEPVGQLTAIPSDFQLRNAYPNPFNPSTTISVSLPEIADLSVRVYNVTGQQVAELANGRISAGQHSFTFDGSSLASGLYFVRANVPGKLNAVQKVMLTK